MSKRGLMPPCGKGVRVTHVMGSTQNADLSWKWGTLGKPHLKSKPGVPGPQAFSASPHPCPAQVPKTESGHLRPTLGHMVSSLSLGPDPATLEVTPWLRRGLGGKFPGQDH